MIIYLSAGTLMLAVVGFFGWRMVAYRVRLESCARRVKGRQAAAAIPRLRALAAAHDGDLAVHWTLAQAYLQTGAWQPAIAEFERVSALNPAQQLYPAVEIARDLATCYEKLGDYRAAQGTLLVALKASPLEYGLLVQVAEIFARRGMPKHAAEYLSLALRIDPENPSLLLRMAETLERAGDLRGALGAAERVPAGAAERLDAARLAARVYFSLSNFPAAARWYGELARAEGTALEGVKGRAECLLAQGNRDAGLFQYQQALTLAGNDASERLPILYRLGMTHVREADLLAGIGFLEEIERIRPDYKDVAQNLHEFRDFRTNPRLSAYAFSSNEAFPETAHALLYAMGLSNPKHRTVKKRDFVFYAQSVERERISNHYVYFKRALALVDERELREIANDMRLLRFGQGIVFSPGDFTREAREFAKHRALTLYGRAELARALESVELGAPVRTRAAV